MSKLCQMLKGPKIFNHLKYHYMYYGGMKDFNACACIIYCCNANYQQIKDSMHSEILFFNSAQ